MRPEVEPSGSVVSTGRLVEATMNSVRGCDRSSGNGGPVEVRGPEAGPVVAISFTYPSHRGGPR